MNAQGEDTDIGTVPASKVDVPAEDATVAGPELEEDIAEIKKKLRTEEPSDQQSCKLGAADVESKARNDTTVVCWEMACFWYVGQVRFLALIPQESGSATATMCL